MEECIQFTVEQETENVLPFLDTVVHRVENIAKFSVYRKPINKDDSFIICRGTVTGPSQEL